METRSKQQLMTRILLNQYGLLTLNICMSRRLPSVFCGSGWCPKKTFSLIEKLCAGAVTSMMPIRKDDHTVVEVGSKQHLEVEVHSITHGICFTYGLLQDLLTVFDNQTNSAPCYFRSCGVAAGADGNHPIRNRHCTLEWGHR
jgi:hypothetical protein